MWGRGQAQEGQTGLWQYDGAPSITFGSNQPGDVFGHNIQNRWTSDWLATSPEKLVVQYSPTKEMHKTLCFIHLKYDFAAAFVVALNCCLSVLG